MLRIPMDRPVDIVLDTDTYNEIDDQFALLYALFSPDRICVNAVYAALFHNQRSLSTEDGMEKSHREILKILEMVGRDSKGYAFKGCPRPMGPARKPVPSDAVDDLIERALKRERDNPLFVVGIGACTNIACALLRAPEIVRKIVAVWMIGNSRWWPDNREFNLTQDPEAAAVLMDSGAAVLQVPAFGVTGFLTTTTYELDGYLRGANDVCDYLADNVRRFGMDRMAVSDSALRGVGADRLDRAASGDKCRDDRSAWSKAIWDVGAIGVLVNPEWARINTLPSPVFIGDQYKALDYRRHLIQSVDYLDRDAIFGDMFHKLRGIRDV